MTEEKKTIKDEVNEVKQDTAEIKEAIKKFSEYMESVIKEKQEEKKAHVKQPKLSKAQKKKGYVNVLYIRENGNVEDLKLPVDEATIVIEKCPRLARPQEMLNWKGNPTIIIGAWNCEPFSPARDYETAVTKEMTSAGHALLLNRLESGEVKGKKSMGGWAIIAIIAALGIVAYLLFK